MSTTREARLPWRTAQWAIPFAVVAAAGPSAAAFTDVTVPYGIDSGHTMSYAAALVDYDGDGDPDLYVTNHWRGPAQLIRNDGSVFTDQSAHLVPGHADRHDQLWADFDNDGDPDQYIIHGRDQDNELFWNEGWGRWTDGGAEVGVGDLDGRGREITVADFNGDQWLDIFVVNSLRIGYPLPNRLFWNDGDGTFTMEPNTTLLFETRLHVASADYDGDGDPDLVMTNPAFSAGEFHRNNGDSTFTEMTATVFPGIVEPLGEAQGISWADYDNDGLLDLLVTGGNRGVWDYAGLEGDSLRWYAECDTAEHKTVDIVTDADSITVDATTFNESPVTCYTGGVGSIAAGFPFTVAIDQITGEPPQLGGQQGLFLWRIAGAGADTVRFRVGGPGTVRLLVGGSLRLVGGSFLDWSSDYEPAPPYSNNDWSNRLYHNEADGTFSEVTQTALSVNDSTMNSAGAAWGDYDNDGWIDVYITNQGTVETANPANLLFRNNGDGTFTDVAAVEGVQGSVVGMGDGACWGDVDADGALDLFVDNGGEFQPFGVGPRQLFRNAPNGNHWLRLKLRGLVSNGSGIGARVRVTSAAGQQYRWRLGESDNAFANDTMIHFGLGLEATIDLTVEWPSGVVDAYGSLAADSSYVVLEGLGIRSMKDPHFMVTSSDIVDAMQGNAISTYPVTLDNLGGLTSNYIASYEDCAGSPISWISVDPESGSVWPGGGDPIELSVNTIGIAPGQICGRVIFNSDSVQGPDTLMVTMDVGPPVSAGIHQEAPARFGLSLPWPNPASSSVSVVMALPEAADVEIAVFDVAGRRVAELVSGTLPAGRHPVEWSARDAAGRPVRPGVYLVRASAGAEATVRKVVIR